MYHQNFSIISIIKCKPGPTSCLPYIYLFALKPSEHNKIGEQTPNMLNNQLGLAYCFKKHSLTIVSFTQCRDAGDAANRPSSEWWDCEVWHLRLPPNAEYCIVGIPHNTAI